jgi:leader peptidase (prepilin peptidase)/N-methyltransferase
LSQERFDLEIAAYVLITFAALLAGWVSNILANRFPIEDRPLFGPIHCMRGGEPLRWYDHFPLFGFLFQKGVCRHCGKSLPWRFPALETLMVIGLVAAWPRFQNAPLYIYIVNAFYIVLMILVGAIDLRHRLIFPVMIYVGCIVALVTGFFSGGHPDGLLPDGLGSVALGALFCGITFQLLYWLAIAIYRVRALGFGDVLLAVLIGMTLGFPASVASLFMGAVLNGIAAVLVWILGRKKRREFIPYGTTLCAATALSIIFGEAVWRWGPLGMLTDLLGLLFNIIYRLLANIFGIQIS